MNETKHNIEISGAIIEQLSSLNEEEPTKYWRAGMKLVNEERWNGNASVFTTERAAWIYRERCLGDQDCTSMGTPYEQTREEVEAFARAERCQRVDIYDETLTVVDWWSVE